MRPLRPFLRKKANNCIVENPVVEFITRKPFFLEKCEHETMFAAMISNPFKIRLNSSLPIFALFFEILQAIILCSFEIILQNGWHWYIPLFLLSDRCSNLCQREGVLLDLCGITGDTL